MEENELFKDYLIIDKMGRVKIPSRFLKYANIQPLTKMQFFDHKNCFVIKQIEFSQVCLKEKMKLNKLIRTIDNLGYITIPKTLREIHNLNLYEKVGVKLINKNITFYKIRKYNKTLGQTMEPIEHQLNKLLLITLKDGKIKLNNFFLKALDLELNMQLQFFIKEHDTLVVKKHEYKFFIEGNISFTGLSRVISKDKYLNIPKKLRDYLNINNGDILEVRLIRDRLFIKKLIRKE
ncbi:AbrB/MazE/SpoVT family DNA-binding domain-containing protein [Priestia megaterium]|uniref:AbrB/MazE/SpoVT family DNA-binding domain-containing protein n=1 Tax=Priestia megaterium TaxID=1404 RepID=UPI0024496696|nr:AbrB/MazE/SpoVT family DNA-binding domain-containing protein [Priestia megaterium]MDH2363766.1 AbrB/MazE/SpoVT family DNA-binding domain-containing protein [Priestia megaterium]